jgi:serpin B
MTRYVLALLLTAALSAADKDMAADNGVAAGLNCFAVASYRRLAPGGGNLIFSPFSISTALSMALAGARGETAAQIVTVLGQAQRGPQYDAALAALVEQLTKSGNVGRNELLPANALWVDGGFAILPDFRRTLESVYRAPFSPLDFQSNPAAAIDRINSWTERQTKGRIRGLFAPGSLDSRTRLVLTSAIYFNGRWQSAFETRNTRPAPFKLPPGGAVETNFMNQTARFGYSGAPTVQVLEMNYAGSPLAFDVILPRAEGGLAEIEKSLTAEQLAGWFSGLKQREVQVSLPKFRAEAEFSLRDTLSQMGMGDAFGRSADFSGIDDRRDLMLSDVRHKAFVDVTEEGTEAAAATGVGVALIAMQMPQHVVFRADHPFLFVIRDTATGAILFAGRLSEPRRP